MLIDLDPQTNATFSCISVADWEKHAASNGTIANLMGLKRHCSAEGIEKTAAEVIIPNVFENMDLLPSHLDLFTIDLDLASMTARETKLKRELADIIDNYDIIVCDCPPNLTIPTQNALAMSTDFVIPISPDYLSGLGVGILLNRVKDFCKDLTHNLNHLGIVISRKGRPAFHRDQIMADIRTVFTDVVLTAEITERVKVSESASLNKSIYDCGDPTAAAEFKAFSIELLKKKGLI